MKAFSYKLIDNKSKFIKGHVFAENIDAARQKLTIDSGNTVLSLKRNYLYLAIFTADTKARARQDDIINFTRQLHILVSAGTPILAALEIIVDLAKNKNFEKVIRKLIGSIRTGQLLSNALSNQSHIFSTEYIALVKAGESSGMLDKILDDLYNLLSWDKQLKENIWKSVRYPLMVITVAFNVMILIFIFVIPRFAKIYKSAKAALPIPTQILLTLSHFILKYGPFIALAILGLAVVGIMLYRTTNFKFYFDLFLLKIPIMGELYHKYLVTRFCKVFPILHNRGVSILTALKINKNVSNNAVYQQDIQSICDNVEKGVSMGDAAEQTLMFNGVLAQMASIGEKSSTLGTMLEKIGELFFEEINYTLENFFAIIEPIFILLMGIMVLGLVLGVMLPMFNLASAFL